MNAALPTGLFTSRRGDWRTPKELYRVLVIDAGRFDVSDRHADKFDAMKDAWPNHWFCNPPYGRRISQWTSRMVIDSWPSGVALLPARTDTRWFHRDILPYARIEFLKGRLHFDDNGPAPFPSMLCWFGGEK